MNNRTETKENKDKPRDTLLHISIHWVQKLWARYKHITTKSDIIYPIPLGRPKNNTLGRRKLCNHLSMYRQTQRCCKYRARYRGQYGYRYTI